MNEDVRYKTQFRAGPGFCLVRTRCSTFVALWARVTIERTSRAVSDWCSSVNSKSAYQSAVYALMKAPDDMNVTYAPPQCTQDEVENHSKYTVSRTVSPAAYALTHEQGHYDSVLESREGAANDITFSVTPREILAHLRIIH